MSLPPVARRALAEFTGTGLLVAVVVGSGIMAARQACLLQPGRSRPSRWCRLATPRAADGRFPLFLSPHPDSAKELCSGGCAFLSR